MPNIFIRVCAFSNDSAPFLVAVAKSGNLPLADVKTLIPNIVGLTFCNSEGYLQCLACDGNNIQPPHHGWLFNENYYAIVGPGDTTVHQDNILPTVVAGHSTIKIEPTVDEQQENNAGRGLNSTSLLSGPPPWVNASSTRAEEQGNGGAVISHTGVSPLVSKPLVSKPKKTSNLGCDVCGIKYKSLNADHFNGKKHRERIEHEAQRQRAIYGHVVNINTGMHVQRKTTGDDDGAEGDNAVDIKSGDGEDADEDDYEADDAAAEADVGVAADELKGNGTLMLGFSGFPKKNVQDFELKQYLSQFGELLHCKIGRKFGGNLYLSTGVADVLFRDLSAQESALQAQHVFRERQCTLSRATFVMEKERLQREQQEYYKDTSKITVVRINRLPKGTKTEDVEKLLAGYAGVKEVFVTKKGYNAYVDFETPFYALQLVKNKPRLEGIPHPLQIQLAKKGGWRPGNNAGQNP